MSDLLDETCLFCGKPIGDHNIKLMDKVDLLTAKIILEQKRKEL